MLMFGKIRYMKIIHHELNKIFIYKLKTKISPA